MLVVSPKNTTMSLSIPLVVYMLKKTNCIILVLEWWVEHEVWKYHLAAQGLETLTTGSYRGSSEHNDC